MHLLLDAARQACIVHGLEVARRLGRDDPDQAGTPAGQGNLGERAGLGMEFGRDVGMIAVVLEAQNQRRLRIGFRRHRYTGGLARRGKASVGGHGEPGRDGATVGQRRFDMVWLDGPGRDHLLAAVDTGFVGDGRLKGRIQIVVGNVETKIVFADLAGPEGYDRAADQARGRVDDSHDLERRGRCGQTGENAYLVEQLQGGTHQGGGASILGSRDGADEDDVDADIGQRQGADQAGRACSGNEDTLRDVGFHFACPCIGLTVI